MKMLNLIRNNLTAIICLFIFSVITINRIINHIPWFDEAHAWTIAEQLGFVDMFNYVKNEGHFFIWQTLLYPFAHSHLIPYPYPMQALNWIFCFSALVLMWWKAPFNNWIKALITFSFPFLGCYGVLARCYSIGILLIFVLAVLYENKLKYPKTYALLLIVCANTSVMALIGASAFGFLFLYDFIRNYEKNDKIWVYMILSFGAFLIFYQLFNMDYYTPIAGNRTPHISIRIFRNSFVNGGLILNCFLVLLFSIPLFRYLYENKSALIFTVFSYFWLLVFSMGVYGAAFWHTYFFFIFLLTGLWLCKDTKNSKWALIVFALISLIFIVHKPVDKDYYQVFGHKPDRLLQFIKHDEILNKSNIIQNHGILYTMIPYIYGQDYILKNHCHKELNTDYDLLNNNNKMCAVKNTMEQAKRYPDKLKKMINEKTYTFIDTREYKIVSDTVKINKFYFEKYKCFEHYCFYKIYVK